MIPESYDAVKGLAIPMDFFIVFELIGTVAFAISGAYIAIENKMDIFGVAILGMTTAVGGGIIRDLILGIAPPTAFQKPIYALLSIFVSLIVFIPRLRGLVRNMNHPFYILIDAVGLAVFTVVGVKAGINDHNAFLAVFVGVLTGVGGGVLRDLFVGRQPAIFKRHFYACASLIGALTMVICYPLGETLSMVIGAIIIFTLRMFAAKYKWELPKA